MILATLPAPELWPSRKGIRANASSLTVEKLISTTGKQRQTTTMWASWYYLTWLVAGIRTGEIQKKANMTFTDRPTDTHNNPFFPGGQMV